jgi:hypothetical protein
MSIIKSLNKIFPSEITEIILEFQEMPKIRSCCIGVYCKTCKTYRNCKYHKCYYSQNVYFSLNFRNRKPKVNFRLSKY